MTEPFYKPRKSFEELTFEKLICACGFRPFPNGEGGPVLGHTSSGSKDGAVDYRPAAWQCPRCQTWNDYVTFIS